MAIDASDFTLNHQQGQDPTSPTFIARMSVVGDAAYATGGSAGIEASLAESLAQHSLGITAMHGYGLTAGAITHIARYDAANDKLLVYVYSTGAEAAAAADLSGVTFDLTFTCR